MKNLLNILKISILSAVVMLASFSCKENQIALYNQGPKLEFHSYVSCVFSDVDYFNAHLADTKVTQKSCEGTTQLIGYFLKTPLTYVVKTEEARASDFPVNVSLEPSYTFPQDTVRSSFKLLVDCPGKECVSTRKTVRSGEVELAFDFESAEHQFGAGRNEHLKSKVNVILQIYPSNWNPQWWGEYSTAKYLFMMETLGTTHNNFEKSIDTQITLRGAYNTYKKMNGPLYGDDEANQTEISFPLNND